MKLSRSFFFCAYGGRRAIAGVEEVPTSVNTLVAWNIGVD